MFLGISMWSFEKEAFAGKMSVADFIRYASGEGYDAVELLDCFWKEAEEEIDAAIKLAGECGIRIGCYSIGNDFAVADENERAKQVEYVKRGILAASRLGAPVLRVFGGSPKEGVSYEDALPWIVEGFRACRDLAGEKNVVMAMENHGTLSGSWKQVLEIAEKVDSTHFGATADFGNFLLVDEAPLDAVKGVLPCLKHIHCKDFRPTPEGEERFYPALSGKRFSGCALGEGVVGVGEILSFLKQGGCKAMISIEYEGLEPASEGVPKSRKYVGEIMG